VDSTLIIGEGMLGQALAVELERRGRSFTILARPAINLLQPDTLAGSVKALMPGLILHTAALTKVNLCEQQPELAMAANAAATGCIVELAAACEARLIYFSTDYVFDGTATKPYLEGDPAGPVNAYGRSKLAGEGHVNSYARGHTVRTSGVFGHRRDNQERNFVKAIAGKLVSSTDEIPVVTDQITSLTYAPHLSELVLDVAGADLPPLTHITSSGHDSWFGWAQRIADIAGYAPGRIKPILSSELRDGVARPQYSVLGTRYPDLMQTRERLTAEAGLTEYLARLSTVTGGQY
jgi:dTDP-4-dehydrorhamnose reductase